MIPMVVSIDIRHFDQGPRRLHLWLPLFLVWLLLAPFLLVLSPFLLLVPLVLGQNPFAVFAALYGLLSALTGTRVEVDSPDAFVFIRIF